MEVDSLHLSFKCKIGDKHAKTEAINGGAQNVTVRRTCPLLLGNPGPKTRISNGQERTH